MNGLSIGYCLLLLHCININFLISSRKVEHVFSIGSRLDLSPDERSKASQNIMTLFMMIKVNMAALNNISANSNNQS